MVNFEYYLEKSGFRTKTLISDYCFYHNYMLEWSNKIVLPYYLQIK